MTTNETTTADTEWVDAKMILVTDHPINSRYGALRIPVETLRRLADEMNQNPKPMAVNHDPTQVWRTRNQKAIVERDPDDTHWRITLDAQVHRDDWDAWHAALKKIGAPGGMSIAVTEPIRKPSVGDGLHIIGDAADFTDEELLALADAAPDPTTVAVDRLYQFAADIEPVRLIIEFTAAVIHSVPVNMLSDWLTEVVAKLHGRAAERRRPPVLDVHYRRSADGDLEVDARLWRIDDSDTADVANRVIKMIKSIDDDQGAAE